MNAATDETARRCRRCAAVLPARSRGSTCPACMLSATSRFGGEELVEMAVEKSPALVFGDYLLEEELAHGGMGVVYRARQLSLDRTVAVKLLLLGKYSSAESLQRFRREAQSAALLRHPGIIAVHEVGETDGQPFIAMEYVHGGSLADRLREHPLPPREAAEIIRAVALALQHAHEAGVLHRDVKPSNLLFDARGEVRITDFGLAKKLDGSSDLTLTGHIAGTPNYLPPEAASGKAEHAGVAGDVYSLGAVLYECLTGRPPFLAESLAQTLRSIAENDPVPLRTLNPQVPADLETICLKALARDPAQRFASAGEFGEELQRWWRGEPILTRPASATERLVKWVRRRPKIAALIALAVTASALAIGTLVLANRRVAAERGVAEARGEESRARLVSMHVAAGARLIDDGSQFESLLHFCEALQLDAGHPDREEIHRRRIGAVLSVSPKLVHFRRMTGLYNAAFSPDGTRAISGGEGEGAFIWETASGRTLRHLQSESSFGFFDPTGRVLTARGDGQLELRTTEGEPRGLVLPVFVQGGPRNIYRDQFSISGDGQWIAGILRAGGVQIFSAETGEPRWAPIFPQDEILQIRLSDDGKLLAVAGQKTGARVVDAATGEVLWTPWPAPEKVRHVVFNKTGTRLAVVTVWELEIWDVNQRRSLSGKLPTGEGVYDLRFSADGKWIGLSMAKVGRILDAETGRAIGEPFQHTTSIHDTVFSADSRWLVTSGYDGFARVWSVPDGRPASPWLRAGPLFSLAMFSADSQHLAAYVREAVFCWRMPQESATAPRFPFAKARQAALSADEQRVIVASANRWALLDATTKAVLAEETTPGPVSLSADARWLWSVGKNAELNLWDALTGKSSGAPLALPFLAKRVAFSRDGATLLAVGEDGRGQLLDRTGQLPPREMPRLPAAPTQAVLSPDGRFAAAVGYGGCAWVLDLRDGRTVFQCESRDGRRDGLIAFSPDSRLAAVRGPEDAYSLYVIETATGTVRHRFAHAGLFAPAFTPDSRRMVLGTSESSAALVDLEAGGNRTPAARDRFTMLLAALGPDGRFLAAANEGGIVQVWELATGLPLSPPVPAPGVVTDLRWNADGNAVLVTTPRGCHSVSIAPHSASAGQLRILAELLSGAQLVGDTDVRPLSVEDRQVRWTAAQPLLETTP